MKKISFLVALSMLGAVWTARSTPFTFAQFVDGGGDPFTFTNNGGTSATFSGSTQGYLTLFSGPVQGQQAVNITLSASAESPGEVVGPFFGQPIDGVSNTLTFTRVSDGANLLTVSFSGDIFGFNGDDSASLSSSTATFSSQFLNFSGAGAESALLDLSAINPSFSPGAGNFASSFIADLTGGFSSANAPVGNSVPDTCSTLAALLGTFGVLLGFLHMSCRCGTDPSLR